MQNGRNKLLVSACLLGVPCRYDGKAKENGEVAALRQWGELIPICPEQLGGLPTPRPPAERQGQRVVNRDGQDVTGAYQRGAEQALQLARQQGCRCALLKEKSPSCGSNGIYDGSFSGKLVSGEGVTAQLLRQEGIRVFGESQAAQCKQWMEGKDHA